jgi:hypothetical protein
MRRVLVALCLAVLSCTALEANAPSKANRAAPRISRPVATDAAHPNLWVRLWKRITGVTTMDGGPPPPPPKEHGPIP